MSKLIKYPIRLSLDKGPDKDQYAKQAECRNCGERYWWIVIPKGVTVEDYRKDLTCSNCEITGDWLIY